MRYFVLWGLGLWLAATLAMRLVGRFHFGVPVVFATYVVTALLIVQLAQRLYAARRLGRVERAVAAASLVLPGMLLDVLSVTFVDVVFPNIPPSQHSTFGGWLLWAYAVALLTGLVAIGRQPHPTKQEG
jgi:hypothetical protein